jgi:hypothetical protein
VEAGKLVGVVALRDLAAVWDGFGKKRRTQDAWERSASFASTSTQGDSRAAQTGS